MVKVNVLVVSSCLARIGSVVLVIVIEGYVDFSALCLTFAAVVKVTLFTRRIINPMVVAVNGDEKNIPILFKYMMSTISTVNVPV